MNSENLPDLVLRTRAQIYITFRTTRRLIKVQQNARSANYSKSDRGSRAEQTSMQTFSDCRSIPIEARAKKACEMVYHERRFENYLRSESIWKSAKKNTQSPSMTAIWRVLLTRKGEKDIETANALLLSRNSFTTFRNPKKL
jgi:hypothetical protein